MRRILRIATTLSVFLLAAPPLSAQAPPESTPTGTAPAQDKPATEEQGRKIVIQHFRPQDQRGLNMFETPKEPGAEYTGFKLDFGAAFTSQVQALEHENTAEPVVVSGVNTNELADITPVVIADEPGPVADEAQIRVVHLSADAPKVDVAPDGGNVKEAIFKNLKYGKAKGYATVPAGEYDLEVRPAGKKEAAFDIPAFTLEAGKSYSAMAIGQLGGGSFDVILVEDAPAN